VASLLVLLMPLWVRSADDAPGRRRVRLWGGVALGVWLALSVFGLFLDRPS
jgi:hypothetical protein